MRTKPAHQPLANHDADGLGNLVIEQSPVSQRGYCADRVAAVQRAQQSSAAERGVHGRAGRQRVADLAQHQIIRVHPKHLFDPLAKVQMVTFVKLHLHDAIDLVLDRIFE